MIFFLKKILKWNVDFFMFYTVIDLKKKETSRFCTQNIVNNLDLILNLSLTSVS